LFYQIASDFIFLLELAANSPQDFTSVNPRISHLVKII